jgi:hypothetical protein
MEKVMAELKPVHGNQVEFRMVYADKEKDLVSPIQDHADPHPGVSGRLRQRSGPAHRRALTKEEVLKKLKELKLIN